MARAVGRAAAAVILAAALVQLAYGADVPPRQTPIVEQLQQATFGAGYLVNTQCKLAARNGQIPVDEHAGRRAIRVAVSDAAAGGSWTVGVSRSWTRFYLSDYLPTGQLRFEVCGAAGGETFRIGFADSSDRSGLVPVTKYAAVTAAWQDVMVPLKDVVAAAGDQPIDLEDGMKVLIAGDGPPHDETFYIRNVRFTTDSPERVYPPIKVDQVGYRPTMHKEARISAPVTDFDIKNTQTGQVVYRGTATVLDKRDPGSGDDVWRADFSAVTAPGTYVVEAPGLESSVPLVIRADAYDRLFVDAMRFYYLQRCGTALDQAHAGVDARPACHLGDQHALTRDGSSERDVSGGWHDAGDCNKYAPWVRYPIQMPLLAYRLRPAAFTDGQLNIPESGNGVPDMLDEVQWELDWLLKMQITEGPQAGAVYDRIHQSAAPQAGEHAFLQEPRRLLPPTDEATAIACGVWATASQTFAGIPQRQAEAAKYKAAAELAWQRLVANKADGKLMLMAAACLYDASGAEPYRVVAERELAKETAANPSGYQKAERMLWDTYDMALCLLATSEHGGKLRDQARAFVSAAADQAAQAAQKDGYGAGLWNLNHYSWSSSEFIGKLGSYGLIADTYDPKAEYRQLAADALHYLLGRNAIDMSLVTGYGTHSTTIFSSVFGAKPPKYPVPPGYCPGGVNQWNSRGISAWPAKNYRSDPNNWTLTEPAIYYNAPLVFLTAELAELRPAADK